MESLLAKIFHRPVIDHKEFSQRAWNYGRLRKPQARKFEALALKKGLIERDALAAKHHWLRRTL